MALVGLAGSLVAVAAVGAQTYAELIAAEERSIGDLHGEIAAYEAQVVGYEADLDALDALIAEIDALIATEDAELALLPIHLELLADDLLDRYIALDEPTAVRHAMAIDAYVRNDEHVNAVLTQSVELTDEALEGIRSRLLYEAVIDDANDQLLALYAELRLLGRRVDGVNEQIRRTGDRRQDAVDHREDTVDLIPGIEAQIGDAEAGITVAEANIAAARAEIERLESLLVTMRWTAELGQDIGRPALAVKIDNVKAAWPQTGVNQADVVYEEIVEAGLTRLVAIFQTQSPGTVGPIRSARTSDPPLLAGFDRPLFAYSGANHITLQIVRNSELELAGYDDEPGAYWRSDSRSAPHNLYASTTRLWNRFPERTEMPPAPFEFRVHGEALHPDAEPAEGVEVDFGRTEVDYSWNGSGWARRQGGSAHIDSAGVQVAPANVVVQFIRYGTSPADGRSPEAHTTGSGVAWILTAGHVIVGEWDRPDESAPAVYHIDGETIRLSPGRTWVALAEDGSAELR